MSLNPVFEQVRQDIFEWDVYNWSQSLDLWEKGIPNNQSLYCLELGARSGGPSLWLALNQNRVICSDIEMPGEQARILHGKYHVTDRIEYKAIDALNIPFTNHFDVIIFKSIIGGISRDGRDENKSLVFEEISKALKPGGVLLFAENLRGSILHRCARKYFRKWGDSWNYMTKKELEACLNRIGDFEMASTGFLSAFTSNRRLKRITGRLDKWLKPIIPFGWKYVVYGYAIKR